MRSFQLRHSLLRNSGLAVAAASALIAVAMPLAFGAPTAAPPSDGEGYVDSTARCSTPDTAVLFGSTQTSRVAICKTTAGAYEYRGVRMADGAKLIVAAKQTSNTTFVANNDGVTYTVTPTALSVTAGGNTFRTETWTDFHGKTDSASATTPSATATATPSVTSAPSTKSSTSAGTSPSKSAAASAVPSSAVPLPPPMAAEVGGGSSSGQ